MIRLGSLPRDPYWLDIAPGLRFQVRPASAAIIMAAQGDPAVSARATEGPGAARAALITSIARIAIMAWDGVVDDMGDPVPVSPGSVGLVLDIYPVASAFAEHYVGPALILEEEIRAEGNG